LQIQVQVERAATEEVADSEPKKLSRYEIFENEKENKEKGKYMKKIC